MKSAFFTGHRNVFGLKNEINQLIEMAQLEGVNHFYCGMALGTDTMAAQVLVELNLDWTAVIPFKQQCFQWARADQIEYFRLIPYAQERIVLYQEYKESSYHERNQLMIDNSELCLAVYDGRNTGGSKSVVEKCEKLQKPMFIYNPKTDKIIKRLKA